MTTDEKRTESLDSQTEPLTESQIEQKRDHLAQLIGRMLAQVWLQRHRAIESGEPPDDSL